eukprot:TRINITY_DN3033_c0_g1_i1.p1 TRINITY_DN3033_c0_g1~~TRINITY_DN3033_c0_g1_i1.p1  ORF type:complete len:1611 (+),score=432.52 TRINITY_DN3033_c0_g1_i1:37-4833(+)
MDYSLYPEILGEYESNSNVLRENLKILKLALRGNVTQCLRKLENCSYEYTAKNIALYLHNLSGNKDMATINKLKNDIELLDGDASLPDAFSTAFFYFLVEDYHKCSTICDDVIDDDRFGVGIKGLMYLSQLYSNKRNFTQLQDLIRTVQSKPKNILPRLCLFRYYLTIGNDIQNARLQLSHLNSYYQDMQFIRELSIQLHFVSRQYQNMVEEAFDLIESDSHIAAFCTCLGSLLIDENYEQFQENFQQLFKILQGNEKQNYKLKLKYLRSLAYTSYDVNNFGEQYFVLLNELKEDCGGSFYDNKLGNDLKREIGVLLMYIGLKKDDGVMYKAGIGILGNVTRETNVISVEANVFRLYKHLKKSRYDDIDSLLLKIGLSDEEKSSRFKLMELSMFQRSTMDPMLFVSEMSDVFIKHINDISKYLKTVYPTSFVDELYHIIGVETESSSINNDEDDFDDSSDDDESMTINTLVNGDRKKIGHIRESYDFCDILELVDCPLLLDIAVNMLKLLPIDSFQPFFLESLKKRKVVDENLLESLNEHLRATPLVSNLLLWVKRILDVILKFMPRNTSASILLSIIKALEGNTDSLDLTKLSFNSYALLYQSCLTSLNVTNENSKELRNYLEQSANFDYIRNTSFFILMLAREKFINESYDDSFKLFARYLIREGYLKPKTDDIEKKLVDHNLLRSLNIVGGNTLNAIIRFKQQNEKGMVMASSMRSESVTPIISYNQFIQSTFPSAHLILDTFLMLLLSYALSLSRRNNKGEKFNLNRELNVLFNFLGKIQISSVVSRPMEMSQKVESKNFGFSDSEEENDTEKVDSNSDDSDKDSDQEQDSDEEELEFEDHRYFWSDLLKICESYINIEFNRTQIALNLLERFPSSSKLFLTATEILAQLYLTQNVDKQGYLACYQKIAKLRPTAENYIHLSEAFLKITMPQPALACLKKAKTILQQKEQTITFETQGIIQSYESNEILIAKRSEIINIKLDLIELDIKMASIFESIYCFQDSFVIYTSTMDTIKELEESLQNRPELIKLKKLEFQACRSTANLAILLDRGNEATKLLIVPTSVFEQQNTMNVELLLEYANNLIALSDIYLDNPSYGTMENVLDFRMDAKLLIQTVMNKLTGGRQYEIKRKLADLTFSIGELKLKTQDADGALFSFNETLKLNEEHVKALIALAQQAYNKQAFEECQKYCFSVVRSNPNNTEACFMLAKIGFHMKNYSTAAHYFDKLLSNDPLNWEVLTHFAALTDSTRGSNYIVRLKNHLEFAKFTLSADPQYSSEDDYPAGYHFACGVYAQHNNDLQIALKHLNILRFDSKYGFKATLRMIDIYFKVLDIYKVEKSDSEQETEKTEPKKSKPNANLEMFDTDNKGADTVKKSLIKSVKTLIDEIPSSMFGQDLISHEILKCYSMTVTENTQELAKAQSKLVEILSTQPSNPSALLCLATVQLRQNDQSRARNTLKKMLRIRPEVCDPTDLENAYLIQAGLYLIVNKFDNALNLCKKALRLNDSCAQAYEYCGDIMEREQSYKNAADYYEKAWQIEGKRDVAIGYKLAFNYLKADRYVDAIDIGLKILEEDPNNEKIQTEIINYAISKLKTES